MFRLIAIFLLFSTPALAHAYEEPSFDEFFKGKNNNINYKKLSESGDIQMVRNQMISICKNWSTNEEDIDKQCKCASKEISKLSDQELFYTSILAYNRYQAKVEAIKNNDSEPSDPLKAQFNKSPLAPATIEDNCR